MVAHYIHGFSVPPWALGRSKVSHRLRLSRREKIGLCLALSSFFLACFSILLLLVTVISSLAGFPTSRDEYHSRTATFGFDKSSAIDKAPLSSLWASYSPYHPAGEYEGSIREGCVVTQVNIVSQASFADRYKVGSFLCVISQLQRHGARYPTTGITEEIKKALKKLQAAKSYNDRRLHFLKKYTYELGVSDLVRYGAGQYVIELREPFILKRSPDSFG